MGIDKATEQQLYEVIEHSSKVDCIAVVFNGQEQTDNYRRYIREEQSRRIDRILEKLTKTGDEWIVCLTSDHDSRGNNIVPVFCTGINTDVVKNNDYFQNIQLDNHKICCNISNWTMWQKLKH
jgi:hypothetical protein